MYTKTRQPEFTFTTRLNGARMKTVGYIPKDKPAADSKNGGNKVNGNKPQNDKPAADGKK